MATMFSRDPLPRSLLLAIALSLSAGCDETPRPKTPSAPSSQAESPSAQGVSPQDQQRFEQRYVELCVKGQRDNPDRPAGSDQEVTTLCQCMAKEIAKRLSKTEAVRFLDKKEIPIDLVMMGNAASDVCSLKR
ncbi:hypothetical protein [Candidatus Methylocalor cossyra]|uniref:Lipoprotein n=1 Tax=Candidatus Methylocalor cossyra TaxID=3108543 RepID=A0ABM9NKW4_9GAMM